MELVLLIFKDTATFPNTEQYGLVVILEERQYRFLQILQKVSVAEMPRSLFNSCTLPKDI